MDWRKSQRARQHDQVDLPLVDVRRRAQELRDSGDVQAALTLLSGALDAACSKHDHTEMLTTARLLARLHREAADPAAARRVLEMALADGRRRRGDHDPLILALSFDLGSVADELGNRHEARRNFSRVASAGPAVFGEDHWTVRAAREYLEGHRIAPPSPDAPPASPSPVAVPSPAVPTKAPATTPSPGVSTPPREAKPAVAPVEPARRSGRPGRATVAAAVAATVAAAAAVAALVVLLADTPAPTAPDRPDPAPSVVGDPPTGLVLDDNGTAITLKWTDPSDGTVPFIVAGGRAGQNLGAMGTVNPGETSHTIYGLNPRLDYCFTVLAVYSTDRYATSGQVCTSRPKITPSAS